MSSTLARKRRAPKKTQSSTFWIIGAVLAAAILVLALVVINLNAPAASTAAPSQVNAGRVLGLASAPVKIDLYSDFQCPICRRADLTLRELAADYIDTGKVQVIYHNFAFIGDESRWAAQAAECANEQGKFWQYASYLFDHQTGENVGAFAQSNLKRFASELGLDSTTFDACLDSGKYAALVDQELTEGRNLGVRATPSFYFNGQFVEGLLPISQIKAMIESYLN